MRVLLLIVLAGLSWPAKAQLIYYKDKIISPYAVAGEKATARRASIISSAESLNTVSLDSDPANTEKIQSALWAISQFLVSTPKSDSGIERLVNSYWRFDEATQRSLLEVLYGVYPKKYYTQVLGFMQNSSHPKNVAIAAAYVYRAYPTPATKKIIRQKAAGLKLSESQAVMIYNLLKYIDSDTSDYKLPPIDSLFAHQQLNKYKVIYSFQSYNRDLPGLAIVQDSNGTFMRDSSGRVLMFQQLARSASNMPWFLNNGSTPQGLFSITGTDVSRNVFIGPTPNLQLVMMNEVNPPTFTHYFPPVFNAPPERLYRAYFPQSWQSWAGLMEAYDAGKIGRTEIIAHGSTIDPEWYKNKPYYPLTPTMGCLCAKEVWNKQNGKIIKSDQLDLVNAFIETPGSKGYLIVINVDDKQISLDRERIEAAVNRFEAGLKKTADPAFDRDH
jgi:hypothetical protein